MSEILEDISYLSEEIGPRPAGTEEENQAALFLAERFEKSAGLKAEIEEFSCSNQPGIATVICFGVPVLLSIIALFFPGLAIIAFLLSAIGVGLTVAEMMGHPLLSKLFNKGISQNVVARYEPVQSGPARRRKVILVANYDSGKVEPELTPLMRILPMLLKVSYGAFALLPVFWLFYMLFGGGIIMTLLILVLIVGCLFPIVQFVIHRTSAFNDAANNNASGAAALVELARLIQDGSWEDLPEFEEGQAPAVYGREAVEQAGLMPEGVPVDYRAAQNADVPQEEPAIDPAAMAERRAETRAVLSGEAPLEGAAPQSQEEEERVNAAVEHAAALAEEPETAEEEAPAVPDWFVNAQKKANKPRATSTVKRSRYAEALDAAVAESSVHFAQANKMLEDKVEARAKAMEREIVEVGAPEASEAKAEEPAATAVEPVAEPAAAPAEPQPVEQAPVQQVQEPVAASEPVAAPEEAFAPQQTPAAPSQTTAMPPIDVSELRAQIAPNQADQVARLQTAPSIDVAPIAERSSERVLVEANDDAQEVDVEEQATMAMPRVTLPEVDPAADDLVPVDSLKQRAPLAAAVEDAPEGGDPSLSSRIPRIEAVDPATQAPMADNKRAALRQTLPSMSGVISAVPPMPENKEVSLTGSFAAVGAGGGSFAPVGDELVADINPEDRYIDDADDSSFDETTTTTGAFAGPGYMEMPDKRRGFFGRFRRKKKNEENEQSTAGWLGVDENFDARDVGAQRGSWESFQDESSGYEYGQGYAADDQYDDYPEPDGYYDDQQPNTTQKWNGGAFSRLRSMVPQGGGAEPQAEAPVEQPRRQRYSADSLPPQFAEVASLAAAKMGQESDAAQIAQETKQVQEFHNTGITTEVWFVALGAQRADNGGIKAFLNEHAGELRGSIIVNLESLGAGELSAIEEEGLILTRKPSSRFKRYLRAAAQATGFSPASATMAWRDSAASVAMRNGFQAITIAGMDDGKPAYYGQADDVRDVIDEQLLKENISFIHNFVKSV